MTRITSQATSPNLVSNALLNHYDAVFFFSTPLADLYSLSYLWISGVSFGAAIVVGLISSLILGNYIRLIIYYNGVDRYNRHFTSL